MNSPRRLLLLAPLLLAAVAAPLHAQREKLPAEDREIVEQRWPEAKKTYTGLRYIILKPGDTQGPTPQPGQKVSVVYKGMLLNGKVFDENTEKDPLKIRLARGDLIDGWEEALQKMHKGEKWLLIVPPEMGYGARGRAPSIGRNATLVFEMELLDFGKDLP
jgi:FKBP-type peptidyl-prolyl cis-trans isomerase